MRVDYWENLPEISKELNNAPTKRCKRFVALSYKGRLVRLSYTGLFLLNRGLDLRTIRKHGELTFHTFQDDSGRNIGSYYKGYVYRLLKIPGCFPDWMIRNACIGESHPAFSKLRRQLGNTGELIFWRELNDGYNLSFSQTSKLILNIYEQNPEAEFSLALEKNSKKEHQNAGKSNTTTKRKAKASTEVNQVPSG